MSFQLPLALTDFYLGNQEIELWKESLNSDGQQFKQNEQSPLILTNWTQLHMTSKSKSWLNTTTYDFQIQVLVEHKNVAVLDQLGFQPSPLDNGYLTVIHLYTNDKKPAQICFSSKKAT